MSDLSEIAREKLFEIAINSPDVEVTSERILSVKTGPHTGRSPNAKSFICRPGDEGKIDWSNNKKCSTEKYHSLKKKFDDFCNTAEEGKGIFTQVLYAGQDTKRALGLKVQTSTAWQALFANNMFVVSHPDDTLDNWTIRCFPEIEKEPIVLVSFVDKEVLISGTWYAGEIKKSVFTVLNYILPEMGILSMHCSVNTDEGGENSAIFFGLSGTGKTTLSADPHRVLIGDDEHGWSDDGLFNIEGGCYAKVINLNQDDEPQIWHAVHTKGTILENVVLNDGVPDYKDSSLTENTRASYPISSVINSSDTGVAGHPSNIIFLTCDAFGVLPPVSALDSQEAYDHFLLGYTAKIAGTERGITAPMATFSPCFGAPFMPLHPTRYASILREKIEKHKVQCWLVNTGWTGGQYGKGHRVPIGVSRSIISSILDGSLGMSDLKLHTYTGLKIPISCGGKGIDEYLEPESRWDDIKDYEIAARKLMDLWQENKIAITGDSA